MIYFNQNNCKFVLTNFAFRSLVLIALLYINLALGKRGHMWIPLQRRHLIHLEHADAPRRRSRFTFQWHELVLIPNVFSFYLHVHKQCNTQNCSQIIMQVWNNAKLVPSLLRCLVSIETINDAWFSGFSFSLTLLIFPKVVT